MKKEKYIGDVIFYNHQGEGVVFFNKKPIYVFGTILGEKIEYEIIEEKKKYGIGKLISIISKSKNRVDHQISDASLIGGYELIHMNEEEQKSFKINCVINDFKKIASINLENPIWISSDKRWKYRNKITLHDGYFFQKNTRTKIDIDNFLLSDIKWDKNLEGTIIYRKLDTLIFGKKNEKKYTTDTMLNINFRVGLNSFYQVNKNVAQKAYQIIVNHLIKNETTLDLYCGIGTITLIVASKSKNVVGIEKNNDSYQDALFNAKNNNIKNVKFLKMNVKKFLESNKKEFVNVIVDPSRTGVGKNLMQLISSKIKPKRIIYMSCNPSTQARDLEIIKEQYNIDKIYILDMFCHTYHIETIAILTRK